MVDYPADRFVDQARLLDVRVARGNLVKDRADQRHLSEVGDCEQTGAQPVIDVVVVVGDVVGKCRDLRLGSGESVEGERMAAVVFGDRRRHRAFNPRAAQRPVVLDRAFERFPSQVEAVEFGIMALEPGQDPQGLVVVREAAKTRHLGVQGFLTGMAERGVAEVMSERQGLGQILVEAERAADGAGDLRHFEAMGQPGAVMIALVIDKDLRLVGQPAKRRRMNDAVPVALKGRAYYMLRLRMEPPTRLLRFRRIGRETDRGDHSSSYATPPRSSIPPQKTEPNGRTTASPGHQAITSPAARFAVAAIAGIGSPRRRHDRLLRRVALRTRRRPAGALQNARRRRHTSPMRASPAEETGRWNTRSLR